MKDRSEGKTRKRTYAATELTYRKENMLEIERASTRWHCVENSLWKSLWTCLKTSYGVIMVTKVSNAIVVAMFTLIISVCLT
jgi:hypothetical protein